MDIYEKIAGGDSSVNWAVYKYNNTLTDLEICKNGFGTLTEIEDVWDETDLLQGVVRVQMDKTLFKIVLITFCGEGASLQKKAHLGQKYIEAERQFKAFKVHILSRFASEVADEVLKVLGIRDFYACAKKTEINASKESPDASFSHNIQESTVIEQPEPTIERKHCTLTLSPDPTSKILETNAESQLHPVSLVKSRDHFQHDSKISSKLHSEHPLVENNILETSKEPLSATVPRVKLRDHLQRDNKILSKFHSEIPSPAGNHKLGHLHFSERKLVTNEVKVPVVFEDQRKKKLSASETGLKNKEECGAGLKVIEGEKGRKPIIADYRHLTTTTAVGKHEISVKNPESGSAVTSSKNASVGIFGRTTGDFSKSGTSVANMREYHMMFERTIRTDGKISALKKKFENLNANYNNVSEPRLTPASRTGRDQPHNPSPVMTTMSFPTIEPILNEKNNLSAIDSMENLKPSQINNLPSNETLHFFNRDRLNVYSNESISDYTPNEFTRDTPMPRSGSGIGLEKGELAGCNDTDVHRNESLSPRKVPIHALIPHLHPPASAPNKTVTPAKVNKARNFILAKFSRKQPSAPKTYRKKSDISLNIAEQSNDSEHHEQHNDSGNNSQQKYVIENKMQHENVLENHEQHDVSHKTTVFEDLHSPIEFRDSDVHSPITTQEAANIPIEDAKEQKLETDVYSVSGVQYNIAKDQNCVHPVEG